MSENSPPPISSDWKPVAFKEWQVVCEALASGEQSLILRKGGISEGKHGFQWIHDKFFMFPSYFHEQLDQVKPMPDGSDRVLKNPPAPKSGTEDDAKELDFGIYCETIETGRLTKWEDIQALDSEHIWKEDIIRERFEWGEEFGISFARVNVWTLPKPVILTDRKGFGGCRSWIGFPSDEVFPQL